MLSILFKIGELVRISKIGMAMSEPVRISKIVKAVRTST